MKISASLYHSRRWLLGLIFALGFLAPMDRMGGPPAGSAWLSLAGAMARYRVLPIAYSSIAVMGAAIFFGFLAALLRTWAIAHIGTAVVTAPGLSGQRLVVAGPYRYARNPLYVGLWLHTLALSVLMPPSGAVFTLAAVALFMVYLAHVEEQWLTARYGEAYRAYRQKVPRFLPALRPRLPAIVELPQWRAAFLAEIYMWGVVVTYTLLAWKYNVTLLEQGVLVSLGIGMVLQGIARPSPVAGR
ncbi:MAG: methyltransferase family protein [Acidobacteriaceae bacterium]